MKFLAFVVCTALTSQPPTTEPTFTFVQSNVTGMHIAVQPRDDHHRVHSIVRIRGCRDKQVFAQVRCHSAAGDSPQANQTTIVSTAFQVRSEDELWSLYFRVPRFARRNATFQLELGEIAPQELNEHHIRTSFAWEVRRDQAGNASFVHDLGNGRAVAILVPQRIAFVEGGEVKIRYAYGAAQPKPLPLQYGFSNSGAQVAVDGESLARKVSN